MDDLSIWIKHVLKMLEKIDDKVDNLKSQNLENKMKLEEHDRRTASTNEELVTIHNQLSEYNEQLRIHIKGVNLLDTRQTKLETKVAPLIEGEQEKASVKKYITAEWKRRLLIIGGIGTAATAIAAVLKLYNMI